MINAREILDEFMSGVGKLAEMDGPFIDKFMALDGAAGGDALPAKTKELIALGVGINKQCKYCICVHTRGAYQAGATRAEIMAAAEVAIAMGGGPAVAYSASVVAAAIDEFEHDFD
ncbi:MAG: carboxymuconolactone decarboxylase family protein [Lachnospiraceae bacterium]|nr:carboxymuconolactone decarboxylase family protein [Lachnospiraceae bacterium]